MAEVNGNADPDTESDTERPAALPANGHKKKLEKPPWQSLFSTANLDNGRLTLQISQVEEAHHQHHFKIPRALTIHKPTRAVRTKTKSAFDGIDTPRLNVVVQIVGSRGDVQPYVALGKALQAAPYNHRVRLATHPNFKDFVEQNGLEFFSIGGDPEALMSYMIKNPGILPGKESRKAGDPSNRRADIAEMLQGCWRSCVDRGDGMVKAPGINKDGTSASPPTTKPKNNEPFIADAIIANPPSYAHIHCAEKLGIPLQLSFTMPWSPTQAFPHPLANITPTNESKTMTNYASFVITDTLTWQGLGDIFNNFRTKTLGLEPINPLFGATIIPRLRVPWTYCWSKALIPKPTDWDSHISISGFYFLELASLYKPPEDLQKFLNDGPPPVYIGFGSITIAKPKETMDMILEAVNKAGVRALISKGWGGLQCNNPPPNVLMLDNCPHDWLFPRVSCVVHHGGAGTTAIGIKLGKPTVVIPFFGDQPFWGGMVFRAGAGPRPVPFKKLTADSLAACLETALRPESLEKARILGKKVEHEDGAAIGAQQFQDCLDVDSLRCFILPDRVAIWRIKHTAVQLSGLAGSVLITSGTLARKNLELVRHREWPTDQGPMAPLGGAIAAVVSNATNAGMGIHNFNKAMRQMHRESKEAKKAPRSPDPSAENVSRFSEDEIMDNYLGNIQDHLLDRDSISSDSSSLDDSPQVNSMDTANRSAALDAILHLGHPKAHSPKSSKHSSKPLTSPTSPSHPSTLTDRLRLHITRRGTFPAFLPSHTQHPPSPSPSPSPSPHATGDHLHAVAIEAVRAANTVLEAGLNTPVELAFNLATGFHNAPILFFGDKTVRPAPKVTGFKSGAKAASSEFVLGFYDGITGLLTQPYARTRDEGWVGIPKGVASGVGGLVMKSSAAVFGVPGYLLKGVVNEFRRKEALVGDRHVLATRRYQSLESLRGCTPELQTRVLKRWEELVARDAARVKEEERRGKMRHGLGREGRGRSVPLGLLPRHEVDRRRHRDLAATLEGASERDLEEAVREAVRMTSDGDEGEDRRIAEAVRASLGELRGGLKGGLGREGERGAEKKMAEGPNGGAEREVDERTGLGSEGAEGLGNVAVLEDEELDGGSRLLQYEVWKRICEAHMGITPQSQLGVAVAT
ncbi:MAG: hypothetical protein MMC23_004608 [Stictis urceolatum]|nr:hypothetical protein [Stictis urceolata]